MLTVTRPGGEAGEVRVSVLLAVHRDSSYLDEAIASVLRQEGVSFELVIIANGGNEELRRRLVEAHGRDPRVVIVGCDLAGLAFALNLGINVARGDYIARADADDLSHPSRLRKQAAFLDAHPKVGIVGSRVRLIGPDSAPIEGRTLEFCGTDREIRRRLPYKNTLIHPALMFRREVLMQMRGYCYGHMSEDHELFLRVARTQWEFANLDEVLFDYRRHPEQITNAGRARDHFVEISGFLWTEFLRTGSPKYLLGMAVVFPPARRLRNAFRRLLYGRRYDGAA